MLLWSTTAQRFVSISMVNRMEKLIGKGDINENQASVWIGKKANESVWLDGILDELRILNIALTEEQIQEDMEGIAFAVEVTGKLTTTWGRIKTEIHRR